MLYYSFIGGGRQKKDYEQKKSKETKTTDC